MRWSESAFTGICMLVPRRKGTSHSRLSVTAASTACKCRAAPIRHDQLTECDSDRPEVGEKRPESLCSGDHRNYSMHLIHHALYRTLQLYDPFPSVLLRSLIVVREFPVIVRVLLLLLVTVIVILTLLILVVGLDVRLAAAVEAVEMRPVLPVRLQARARGGGLRG